MDKKFIVMLLICSSCEPSQNNTSQPDVGVTAVDASFGDSTAADLSAAVDAEAGDGGHVDISPADLSRGDLGRGDVSPADLGPGDVSPADLGRGDLSRGDLGRGDVSPADLGPGDLSRGDLGRSDLGQGDVNAYDSADAGISPRDASKNEVFILDSAPLDVNKPDQAAEDAGSKDVPATGHDAGATDSSLGLDHGVVCGNTCIDDDGCCPAACSPLEDTDCAALCPEVTKETRDPWLLWPGYQIYRPHDDDGSVPRPVIMAIHGGGGTATAMAKQTCLERDLTHPSCLHRLAPCLGWTVIYTNGSVLEGSMGLMRGFNATATVRDQDMDPWLCTTGNVCTDNVDHVGYHGRVLDDLQANFNVDTSRVFATGLSNGAAMSHRLGCELSDRIAAIAPVAAGNQFEAVNGCTPGRSVPVLQIHGELDFCWPYDDEVTLEGCSALQAPGVRHSVPASMAAWASNNGCDATPIVTELEDRFADDNTSVTRLRYVNCDSNGDVELLRVNGGGHTWPGGSDGLPVETVGVLSHEIVTNHEIIRFFEAHPMP